MAVDANLKLVAVKAFARGNAIPLDSSSVYDSLNEAESYASTSPVAYEGQIISVIEDGVPRVYSLKSDGSGHFTLFSAGMTAQETYEAAAPEWGAIGS